MLTRLKKNRIFWEIFRVVSNEYQPPFGSVGHSIQSGRITKDEAAAYLERTNKPKEHT